MKLFNVKKSQLVIKAAHPHKGRPGRQGGSAPGRGRQKPAPLGSIVPSIRMKIIDTSVSPPKWKTIAEGIDAPVPIQKVIKQHNLQGVWVFDSYGDKRYESIDTSYQTKKSSMEPYLAISPRMTEHEREGNKNRIKQLEAVADEDEIEQERAAHEGLRNRQPQAAISEQNKTTPQENLQYYGKFSGR